MKKTTKKKIRKGDFGYIKVQQKKRILYTVLAFIAPLLVFFYRIVYQQDQKYHIYSGSCGGLSSRLQICGGHDHDVSAETYGRRRLPGDRKT